MSTTFWEQVIQLKTTDCWPWNGMHDESGRPIFNSQKAYRVSYELRNGDLRSGNHVHHKCENSSCVNPKHLIQLTPEEHAAAHKALRLNDEEALRRIYSGQWRIDSINYEEERRKREIEAAERRRELEARCEEARQQLEREAKAKAARRAKDWWYIKRAFKFLTGCIAAMAIFLLMLCVSSGRIWISASGIQNNMSEDISGRTPIRHDSEKIIFGMGDSVGKHQDGPTVPRWRVELDEFLKKSNHDPVIPAQEVKPPRAEFIKGPYTKEEWLKLADRVFPTSGHKEKETDASLNDMRDPE